MLRKAATTSSTESALKPLPSIASVTSELSVIGVTRLMRTQTSKASFCTARLSSSGLGSALGSGLPRTLASEIGSPKRKWMFP